MTRDAITQQARQILLTYDPVPRDWQKEALRIWSINYRGTVSVVTGGGKTIFCFLSMKEALSTNNELRFLIIVPTIALLDQWFVSLVHDLRLPEGSIHLITSASQSTDLRLINLCIINSGRNTISRLTKNGHWFVCVDECHRAGSLANSSALQGKFEATLGMSATPRRQYDAGFEDRVAPILGDVIFEYSFQEALEDGVVTPFLLKNYKIWLTTAERKQYDYLSRLIAVELQKQKKRRNEESKRLERLLHQRASVAVNARWRIPSAVLLATQFSRPTIIFHERIAAANEIADLVQKTGRRAVTYHTGLSRGMRQRNLALFREGIADILVTCKSLDEGLNVPEAEIGIMAASSRSIRQRIQRLGRVIRRSPGKERSIVCTLYATESEETQLQSEGNELSEIINIEWYEASIRND